MKSKNGASRKASRGSPQSRAATSHPLTTYFSEIARYPLLSKPEEDRLAREYRRTGDPKAAQKLITGNLRFVVKICKEYQSSGLAMPDLVQEGNLGLMRAIEKFDPEKNVRLTSYAVWWIRAYIREYIIRSWSLVRLGTTQAQRKLFFCLSRTKRELEESEGELGARPSAERIAEALRVRPADVLEMEGRLTGRDQSLDAPVGENGGTSRVDFVVSDDGSPHERLMAKEEEQFVSSRVKMALAALDERQRLLIKERAMSDKATTLSVLGRRLGLSAERARQLEAQAKAKLRDLLEPVDAYVGMCA
jgi:RNA polymerase sigma-32 factor